MSPPLSLLFAFGRPLSPIYSLLMTIRQQLYRSRVLTVHRLPVPVISVGNLTMGGTGKTPTVAYIAQYLRSLGHRPAVISRGYGGSATAAVNVVSDGDQIYLNAHQAGDEPYMLACNLRHIPVLTGKIRLHPCRHAIERLGSTILILDDGFQHLSIARDIDLVLFNATTLAGNSRVFPGGELREPVSALNRCSAFLLTGITDFNRQRAERFADLLQKRFAGREVFYSSLEAIAPEPLQDGPTPAGQIGPVYAFCAIAHPDRFFTTLASLDIPVLGQQAFRDHHRYNQQEIDAICQRARLAGAGSLITTEKDRGKLETLHLTLPLLTLKTSFVTGSAFPEYLGTSLQQLPPPAP
ncbi:MAG: tetraacyldisaccharide 4'-kinase [Desulfobulbaceae bacterium]|nr:MAG: tetraacyldisaccharide 4'-kinase [Desulfobulbaceae bacterium]